MVRLKYGWTISSALLATSVAFFALSIWFAFLERYIPSLLSLTSGLILLSSALGMIRELSESELSGKKLG